jgi:hypothetical protein
MDRRDGVESGLEGVPWGEGLETTHLLALKFSSPVTVAGQSLIAKKDTAGSDFIRE